MCCRAYRDWYSLYWWVEGFFPAGTRARQERLDIAHRADIYDHIYTRYTWQLQYSTVHTITAQSNRRPKAQSTLARIFINLYITLDIPQGGPSRYLFTGENWQQRTQSWSWRTKEKGCTFGKGGTSQRGSSEEKA